MRRSWESILTLMAVAALPLLSYPLSWLPSAQASYRYIVLLPVGPILAVGVLVLFGGGLFRGRCRPLNPALLWPLGLMVFSWLLATRFSRHPEFSVRLLPVCLGNLAAFWLGLRLPVARRMELGWCWLTTAVLVAVMGLMRLWGEPDFVSTIGNRNFLGAYLAASVLIGFGLLERARDPILEESESRRDRQLQQCAILAGCGALLAAMCYCRSRGAWLALGGALCLCFLGDRRGRWKWLFSAWAMATILVAVKLLFFSPALSQWAGDVRPLIWRGTMRMAADRPIIGHGLGTFALEYPRFRLPEYFTRPKAANLTDHAHNELLETAAEQGLAGLAGTLWLWGVAFWFGFRRVRSGRARPLGLDLALLGAAAVFVLHGMVDVDLRFPPNQTLFWLLLGMLAKGEETGVGEDSIRISSPWLRWLPVGACLGLAVWVGFGAVTNPVRAAIWDRRAHQAVDRGDAAATLAAAQRSLAIDPWRLETRYFLAGILARIPNPAMHRLAIEEGLQIEAQAGDYGDITFNLGQLYLADQRPREALPYLIRAADINPYDANRRYLLALALSRTDLREEAIGQVQEALRLDPAHQPAWELLAELQRRGKP